MIQLVCNPSFPFYHRKKTRVSNYTLYGSGKSHLFPNGQNFSVSLQCPRLNGNVIKKPPKPVSVACKNMDSGSSYLSMAVTNNKIKVNYGIHF